MNLWLAPDRLFDGDTLHHGLALRLHDGVVIETGPTPKDAIPVSGTVTPGFVDLQVNGGGGTMVNNDPTPQGLRRVIDAHRALGTVALLPTVITDAPEVLDRVTQAALSVARTPGFLGLHIEGPHIAVARRGTHAETFIRPLDESTLGNVRRLRAGAVPVMLTLAPENATPAQVRDLCAMGVIVALGHSDAARPQVQAMIDAGATCGTHLFNAMSQMTARAPGMVGTLISSDCYLGIICDGHHVADDMIGLAIRARPSPDRMILVSDAMATVGGPDQFNLYGQDIRLQKGRLVNAEGNLAGAHVTQAQGVQRLVNHVGVDLQTALRMAIRTPAQCIGRPDLATVLGRTAGDVMVLSGSLDLIGDLGAVL